MRKSKARKKTRGKKNSLWFFILLATLITLVFYADNSLWMKKRQYPLKYEDLIIKYAEKYSVDPFLVASVIFVESRYIPDAVSPKDAKGLMQILPSTGEWAARLIKLDDYEENHLFSPEVNIQMGCWYLSFLTSQFPDSRELVLASYNGGIGNVRKWLENKEYSKDGRKLDYIPYRETRNYVVKVENAYEIYREVYPHLNH
jgi:soluble lytic murein transglycosylase